MYANFRELRHGEVRIHREIRSSQNFPPRHFSEYVVYSPTSLGVLLDKHTNLLPSTRSTTTCKTSKSQVAGDGVLPSKCWCTLQQGTVYSLANVGVLSNNFWCTPRQEMVYCPTSLVTYFACKKALYTQ